MNIRPATDSDSAAIKRLIYGVLGEYGLRPDPDATDRDLDNIERTYSDNGSYFGVVEEQGRIVATVALLRIDETTCELRKMYALPDQRGRGLGRQLLTLALDKARQSGFKRVVLETASPLHEAIGLYQRFGFRAYQPDHMSCRCDQAMELYL